MGDKNCGRKHLIRHSRGYCSKNIIAITDNHRNANFWLWGERCIASAQPIFFQLVVSNLGKFALGGNAKTFDRCWLPKRGGLTVRARRHLALAEVACQLMDISAGIRCWPTTLSYWSLHVAWAPLFAPCIITANNSSLVSAAVGARKETTCANLSKAASIRRRHRPAAAQLAFTSSCCGKVHVKYGILNKECCCHEIGPILADELFTAFWQGMAVVVKP